MSAEGNLPSSKVSATERGLKRPVRAPRSRLSMRVRITKALAGSIDGIQLSRLSKGRVYDINTSLACYLLSEEMAEPASGDEPAFVVPVARKLFEPPAERRGRGVFLPRSLAADDARKNPKRHRNKKEE